MACQNNDIEPGKLVLVAAKRFAQQALQTIALVGQPTTFLAHNQTESRLRKPVQQAEPDQLR